MRRWCNATSSRRQVAGVGRGRLAAIVVTAFAGGGCASRHAVPPSLTDAAHVPGMPEIRTWANDVGEWFREDLANSARQEEAWYAAHPELTMPGTVEFLTISGGGQHGAFGAGLLCGWTEAGNRPEFKMVTGISTGALIAPWAFLGPKYDHMLRSDYTEVSSRDIYSSRGGLFAVLSGASSMESTKPLQKLVAAGVTEDVLRAIAAEHARGRRLYVVTTNLDAQQPVIWDMGRIAASDSPSALALFRQVLVASASLPVAFNPQFITVEADGRTFDEMHVDGGTTMQVFLWGAGPSRALLQRELGNAYLGRTARLYIIRNGYVGPEPRAVRPHMLSIAGAAAATLILSDLESDLRHLYNIAQRDDADYNLACIPRDFTLKPKSMFDEQYMDTLFQMAHQRALSGDHWDKEPPLIRAESSPGG